jgi:hypothetical protein
VRFLRESPVVGKLNLVDARLHSLQQALATSPTSLWAAFNQEMPLSARRKVAMLPDAEQEAAGRQVLRDLNVRYVVVPYVSRPYWERVDHTWLRPEAGEDDWQRVCLHRAIVTDMLGRQLGLRLVGDDRSDARPSVLLYEVPPAEPLPPQAPARAPRRGARPPRPA